MLIIALFAAATGCDLKSEDGKLKIGVLPILDVLPLYVAEQEGYFGSEGIEIELVPFASALERDAAFQADQIDGEVNDLISAVLLNKDQSRARVVRTAMRATPDTAMFAILAADGSGISRPSDLGNVEIAVSTNTVIEYIVDRLLVAEGLEQGDIATTAVPKIPVRLELLSQGTLKAACLPEPLASLAVAQGAHLVIDDRSHPQYAQSVVTMSTKTLGRKPTTVKRFLAAYEKAVTVINEEPERFRALLTDKGRVPPPVQDTFTMPFFPPAGTPSGEEVDDVLQWMGEKGLVEGELSYDQLVSDSYLPAP